MSWLFIDTTRPDAFRYGLLSTKTSRVFVMKGRSRGLLPAIDRRYDQVDLKKLKGICVVHGPGSFSAVRGGVIVANLLARLLRKPLVGVDCTEATDLETLAKNLEAGKKSASSYVMPTYDAEPNITMSACPTP